MPRSTTAAVVSAAAWLRSADGRHHHPASSADTASYRHPCTAGQPYSGGETSQTPTAGSSSASGMASISAMRRSHVTNAAVAPSQSSDDAADAAEREQAGAGVGVGEDAQVAASVQSATTNASSLRSARSHCPCTRA